MQSRLPSNWYKPEADLGFLHGSPESQMPSLSNLFLKIPQFPQNLRNSWNIQKELH